MYTQYTIVLCLYYTVCRLLYIYTYIICCSLDPLQSEEQDLAQSSWPPSLPPWIPKLGPVRNDQIYSLQAVCVFLKIDRLKGYPFQGCQKGDNTIEKGVNNNIPSGPLRLEAAFSRNLIQEPYEGAL